MREDEREDLLGDLDSEENREDPSDEDGTPPSKKIKLSSPKTVSLLQAVNGETPQERKEEEGYGKVPSPFM